MNFGIKDVIRLIFLYIIVFIFTYFVRDNYTIYEIIGAMIFVTIIYIIAGILVKRKKK